ncbi:MAG: hypothetical protein QNL77_07345 [Akkermansiaceae bacterium]
MFHSISDQKNESSPPLSNQSSGYDRYQTLDVPEDTLYDLPPLTVAKNFALSDSVRERLKWASKPEEITSRLPEYSEQALELPASSIRYLSQITLKSLIYETFVAEFADGSQRLLCVIGTPSGPKVDWDAYARYGNASWESILKGEVEGATVRVMPTPSTYYTGRFSDRDKWSAYALESPDIEIPVYGYLPKGSQLDKSLRNRVRAGAKRAVLSLKFTKETIYGRQAEITEIKTSGWVEK